jgi:membrane associated rhomboid family serine protease
MTPLPPAEGGYGFSAHGLERDVGREELVRLFARGDAYREIDRVRTPETPGLVAPEKSALVVDTFARRLRKEARDSATQSVLFAAVAVLLLHEPLSHRDPVAWFVICVFFGIPLVSAVWTAVRARASARSHLADLRGSRRLVQLVVRSRPIGTWSLLAALIGVFLVQLRGRGLMSIPHESFEAAGLVKDRLREEPWRLLTAILLHGHSLHLFMNGMALLGLGRVVEGLAGRSRLLLVFLASAIAGSLASWWLMPSTLPSVGASGGLMGLMGFLTVVTWLHRRTLPRSLWRALLTNVALMALIGVLGAKWIDNAAHGGGLVAGALLGFALARRSSPLPLRAPLAVRLAGFASAAVLAAGIAGVLSLLLRR